MKRIIARVAVLAAAFAIAAQSQAAPISYILGTGPGQGPSVATSLSSTLGVVPVPFAAGSMSVNFDDPGNVSVTGNFTSIFFFDFAPFGIAGTLFAQTTATFDATGGVLNPSIMDVTWGDGNVNTAPLASGLSFAACTGEICGLLSALAGQTLTEGVPFDVGIITTINGGVAIDGARPFGVWDFASDPTYHRLYGTSNIPTALVGSALGITLPDGTVVPQGAPQSWLNLRSAPEPGTLALVLLGLGGLALRVRKA